MNEVLNNTSYLDFMAYRQPMSKRYDRRVYKMRYDLMRRLYAFNRWVVWSGSNRRGFELASVIDLTEIRR